MWFNLPGTLITMSKMVGGKKRAGRIQVRIHSESNGKPLSYTG